MKTVSSYIYNGKAFRTRRDARWAAFFDACNEKWKYMPKAAYLGRGAFYQPTFELEDPVVNHSAYGTSPDFCVTVTGRMDDQTAMLIRRFVASPAARLDDMNLLSEQVLVAGNFPTGKTVSEIMDAMKQKFQDRHPGWPGYYSFESIDGKYDMAFPGLNYRGKLMIFGTDPGYLGDMDWKATEEAYLAAQNVQLEQVIRNG